MDVGVGAGQGGLEPGQAGAHGAGAVDPGGRANHLGNAFQRHALQHQPVMGVHRKVRSGGEQLGDGGVGDVGDGGGFGHDRGSI